MTRMLDAALHYRSNNIPVFPVGRVDKHPLCEHGLKDTTVDENQIRNWWQIWPNAMIGIATGPRSGLWVLDIDVNAKKDINGHATIARLEIEHGALPLTLCSITPRGGQHYLFRWNGANIRNSVGKIAPGIDVRGDGGYFVAPPSARADGVSYHWKDATAHVVEAPAWLTELALAASSHGPRRTIIDLNANGAPQKSGGPSSARDHVWARAALQRECSALHNNHALNVAAFNLGQIVGGGELTEQEVIAALIEGAEACGLIIEYGEPSVSKTIDSGLRAGMKYPRQRPR
jgi:bifunctional DNA primase/polymerase-like protein